MHKNDLTTVDSIIRNYLDQKERSLMLGKKGLDAEKEYNRLLAKYNGESKTYSLEQANRIYKAHSDMIVYGEEAGLAQARFIEAEEKLREAGRILFNATITAEIEIPPSNGDKAVKKEVTVAFNEETVIVTAVVMREDINVEM